VGGWFNRGVWGVCGWGSSGVLRLCAGGSCSYGGILVCGFPWGLVSGSAWLGESLGFGCAGVRHVARQVRVFGWDSRHAVVYLLYLVVVGLVVLS